MTSLASGMKDTMVKSYECPICHEEITAEKLVILPEDEHELHEELLGNIGGHMFSCHEAKRTPDAEQVKARIAELNAALDKAAHQLRILGVESLLKAQGGEE